MSGFGPTLWVSAVALLGLMLVSWAITLPLRDVSWIDVIWGVAFVLVAWIAYAVGDGDATRRLLVALMITVWGLRLAGYLGWRKARDRREDPRYTEWRRKYPNTFALRSLVTVFLLQGTLVWVVSLPVQAAASEDGGLGALDYVGIAVWAAGLLFESVGDFQLARFKADPANKGKVMNRGLWSLTRHPNYFGDFLVWWGLFIVAVSAGAPWWTVIGPLVMTTLLVRVSGKGHLERSMSKRPGYDQYMRSTSGFVPLPPRR